MKSNFKMDKQIISSHDIEDQDLTDKISVAKLIRVSSGLSNDEWSFEGKDKPLWIYKFLKPRTWI